MEHNKLFIAFKQNVHEVIGWIHQVSIGSSGYPWVGIIFRLLPWIKFFINLASNISANILQAIFWTLVKVKLWFRCCCCCCCCCCLCCNCRCWCYADVVNVCVSCLKCCVSSDERKTSLSLSVFQLFSQSAWHSQLRVKVLTRCINSTEFGWVLSPPMPLTLEKKLSRQSWLTRVVSK